MNFAPLVFYDTFEVVASLPHRIGLFRQDADVEGRRVLMLRAPRAGEDENADSVAFGWNAQHLPKKWPQIHNLLGRMLRDAKQRVDGDVELGRIYLEMLDPGAVLPWQTLTGAYIERYTRTHLALRTNPATMMFSGNETYSPAQGWLTAINARVRCSASNDGAWPRIHLIADVRKKEPTDGA
mgnify:CR=1 FL=1